MRIPRAIVLCLLLAGCSAHRPGGRDRLNDGPFLPPPPIQAPAPIGVQAADDHYVRNGRREPVFGEREPQPERDPPTEPEVPLGPPGITAMEEIIWGAKLQKECLDCEEHHLFPQQEGLRALFRDVGIEVDDWAVLIPKDQHRQAHRKDGGHGPGGKWNWDWEQWWKQRDVDTSADDVFVRVQQMIHEHKLGPYGLPIQYGHGRTISRDLYDIVQPPRRVR